MPSGAPSAGGPPFSRCPISRVATPRGSLPPGARTRLALLRQPPPFPRPPPSSQPAAPHRRGGFLSCTVSMALPAAALTRSVLHPPRGPPRARPADPPTLPLSAHTGSGARRGELGGAARTAGVTWCAGAWTQNSRGSCPERLKPGSGLEDVSLRRCLPKTVGPRAWNPSLPQSRPLFSQTEVPGLPAKRRLDRNGGFLTSHVVRDSREALLQGLLEVPLACKRV
ncbi:uncharacterized protein LOC118663629 [Myotis myotis]|uniref:uncharacterized protein LOC118663629 n=1 Tax=Myotis myotis TaxID=51298 RepID=UPI00174D51BE|nr:uncharacterized protein LOC118663629 [Myotis myotis]